MTEIEKGVNKNTCNRKEKKKEKTYKNNKKEEKDTKPEEKKYVSTKEALKGISKELIQMYKSAGASCWRCGRSNHYTTECDAETSENGNSLEKPTIRSQNKRKRKDDDEQSKDRKKAKSGAIRAEPEEQQHIPIWDMDTDSEEDF
jgi:predicted small secreted protein